MTLTVPISKIRPTCPRTSRSLILALAALCSLSLASCETFGGKEKGRPEISGHVDRVLVKAAREAHARGDSEKSLVLLERLYKRHSGDPAIAAEYAGALRRNNEPHKALMLLSSFARSKDTATPAVLIELARVNLALGRYGTAADAARRAIAGRESEAWEAYHVLGIALDAQGEHEAAEQAYRKGLENWQGDPVPILNNLALALAAQEYLDEAVAVLEKAAEAAPGRMDIERNLRILRALNEKIAYAAPPPVPGRKPQYQR